MVLPPSPLDDTDADANMNENESDMDGLGSNERVKVFRDKIRKREFGSDAEMLARALCAEKGWNALVSRRGRGCLACAIREAGALGWGVVLRV